MVDGENWMVWVRSKLKIGPIANTRTVPIGLSQGLIRSAEFRYKKEVFRMSDRYSRQVLFSPIGKEGQAKIRPKHCLIIGAGALGSGNAEMLTRAGIGKLTIVDRDYVEESNLQRQQLYTEQDVEQKLPKAAAAEKRLRAINSEVEIHAIIGDANPEKLDELVKGVDLIIDSTDNFETRMAINDISQKYKIPWVYGACVGSYGMSFTIIPGKTPCLNCLLKTIPMQGLTCDTAGIISPAVGMVVAHQIAEALKILVEDWDAVRPSFVSFDLWRNQYSSIKMSKAKDERLLIMRDTSNLSLFGIGEFNEINRPLRPKYRSS